MTNTKRIPKHWSGAKTEAEEARWWDANSERLMLQAARRGEIKMSTLKQLIGEMEAKKEETRLLSLRLAVSDIEMAKAQAQKKGLGYQTYIKSLLHQALTSAASGTK